jgi:hypothetical protein
MRSLELADRGLGARAKPIFLQLGGGHLDAQQGKALVKVRDGLAYHTRLELRLIHEYISS